ncbi:MAG: hypothetical protein ABIH55_02710 [Nanoarchaeota archaeon]
MCDHSPEERVETPEDALIYLLKSLIDLKPETPAEALVSAKVM